MVRRSCELCDDGAAFVAWFAPDEAPVSAYLCTRCADRPAVAHVEVRPLAAAPGGRAAPSPS